MKFQVRIVSKAKKELTDHALWWSEHRSVEQAARWLDGFERALQTLQENPEWHSIARESPAFSVQLREIHYGLGSQPTHRAIFEIRGTEVVVYSIRHHAQRDLKPEDLK